MLVSSKNRRRSDKDSSHRYFTGARHLRSLATSLAPLCAISNVALVGTPIRTAFLKEPFYAISLGATTELFIAKRHIFANGTEKFAGNRSDG